MQMTTHGNVLDGIYVDFSACRRTRCAFRFGYFRNVSNKILRFIEMVDSLFAFSVHRTHYHCWILLSTIWSLVSHNIIKFCNLSTLHIASHTDAHFYLRHHFKYECRKVVLDNRINYKRLRPASTHPPLV